MRILLSTLLVLVTLSLPTFAADREIVSAGEAIRTENFITETPFEYMNFYDRRFDYKESRDALRANIEQRRAHYNSARTVVVEDYDTDLHSLHAKQP